MTAAANSAPATQHIVKIRRDYNTWVANETLEDYALRFTPRSFRKWSEFRVANTAFGAASFLVLEAIGATMLVNYGFTNAFYAILAMGTIIFLTGLPISYYAARYGVDMDLLTRGAGFGYLGSTITSLIYASFTFILFALEAAIMAYALELALGIPPHWGYLICALIVIPLATHGVTLISRFQVITQPVWLMLLALPYVYVIIKNPEILSQLQHYGGTDKTGGEFDWFLFASGMTVGLALITQIGEQVDYLRFMPEKTTRNRGKWYAGIVIAGPGWILLGIPKMLGGALLAFLAIQGGVSLAKAIDPNQMYLAAFNHVFTNPQWAVAITALFVIISQLKINITNAYAGSLAWSNFFSRVTHSHPGRVVWMIFNVLIAFMLMEMNVFQALEQVLGLYANVAISWVVAVVADLVVNKPLGLSPRGIEFRRAHLYAINPVGVGAMLIASALSIATFVGAFGDQLQGFSAFVAMVSAFVASPLIAWATRGRYYIAREPEIHSDPSTVQTCGICNKHYETDDMAQCPAYQDTICSLCCTLDARCHDACKPEAQLSAQWTAVMQKVLPRSVWQYMEAGLGHYLLTMSAMLAFLGAVLGLIYYHETLSLSVSISLPDLQPAFLKIFAGLLIASGVAAWWLVLTNQSRRVAQEESRQQTGLLMQEIEAHQRTDEQLQNARQVAESANQAKSRYLTGMSHELRTPLNSILGYAQILDGDESIPTPRRQAISVIRRSGEHLLSLIEGALDIARIESGKLAPALSEVNLPDFMQQIVSMFEPQAHNKGIDFHFECSDELPAVVRTDKKHLGQILINILGNAVKFTTRGSVILRLTYAREIALFEIEDSGPGIPDTEVEHIFDPFMRGDAAGRAETRGTGLGLTISKMLTEFMGGELSVNSTPDVGTRFKIRLYLPQVHAPAPVRQTTDTAPLGYTGRRRRILIVDNEAVDRELLANVLAPLKFELQQARSGAECIATCPQFKPDLILMDLAMPNMDGWETIRQLRQQEVSQAPVAIVSANAFDKGLENDVAISTDDFILKPVNVAELVDWIGRRLELEWIKQPPNPLPSPAPRPEPLKYPSVEDIEALNDLVAIGYVRGILEKLDAVEQSDRSYSRFTDRARDLTRQFRLEALSEFLKGAQHT
jgi:signal transduction histidine kinase/ActR/RegA family two-component response regulator